MQMKVSNFTSEDVDSVFTDQLNSKKPILTVNLPKKT